MIVFFFIFALVSLCVNFCITSASSTLSFGRKEPEMYNLNKSFRISVISFRDQENKGFNDVILDGHHSKNGLFAKGGGAGPDQRLCHLGNYFAHAH